MESDVITLQDLFEFKIDSVVARRTIIGALRSTGLRPTSCTKFERRWIALSTDLFVRDESFDIFQRRERR